MAALTPCQGEMVGFYQCLVTQPVDHWECAEDGVAAIRDGFCDDPQRTAIACMESKMQRR
jgi:hypothetical protein